VIDNDQIRAAVAETREMIAHALPGAQGIRPMATEPDWFRVMFDRFLTPDTPRCPHLAARPVQPALLTVCVGRWLCRRCITSAPRPRLTPIEEGTCDRCRRYVGSDRLTAGILRSDLWTLIAGLCPRCRDDGIDAGGLLCGDAQ
jgi:hypothetical protein